MAVIKKDNLIPICVHTLNVEMTNKRSNSEPTQRRRKITCSPPSLKRACTTTFLQRSGLEVPVPSGSGH